MSSLFCPDKEDFFDFRSNKIPLSANVQLNGWFFLHLLVSFSSDQFKNYQEKNQFSVEPIDMLHNNWYRVFLNESSVKKVSNSKEAEIFSVKEYRKFLRNKPKRATLGEERGDFFVTASKDWQTKIKTQRVFKNYYIAQNATISELFDDVNVYDAIPNPKRHLLNRYVGGYLQSGKDELGYQNNQYIVKRNLQEIGLDGKGIIVNVVDTGIDTNHVFFHDANVKVPYNKTDLNHRKIVRYDPVVDKYDSPGGHGTHVAGTIAGESLDSKLGISAYNGIAPKAKLYCTDLGDYSVSGDLSGEPNIESIITNMDEMKCQISSNSWNFNYFIEEQTILYDLISAEYPQILNVFANGNEYQRMSILSPCDAVNVLSVGWTTKPTSSRLDNGKYAIYLSNGNEEVPAEVTNLKYINNIPLPPSIQISNTFTKNSAVLYTETSGSEAAQQAKTAESAFIISRITIADYDYVQLTQENFDKVKTWTTVSVIFKPTEKEEKLVRSPGSSTGPSDFGALKPDIVIPGVNIVSAKSSGQTSGPGDKTLEGLITLSGSSMATPAAAGLTAIAQQYFQDGYYPTLEKNPNNADKIVLSSLLRATIINSARPIEGSTYIPDYSQGFGCPALADSLGFGKYGVRFVKEETIKSADHHMYKIKTAEKSLFSVTVSYIDKASRVGSSFILYEEINLVVVAPNGDVYNGNGVDGDPTTANERVVIENAEIGEYEIHVISRGNSGNLDTLYSVAVMGGFSTNENIINPTKMQKESNVKCINDCGDGTCDQGTGKCTCPLNKTGAYCQVDAPELEFDKEYTLLLQPRHVQWFYVKTDPQKDLQITLSKSHNVRLCILKPHSQLSCSAGGLGCTVLEAQHSNVYQIVKNIMKDAHIGIMPIFDVPFTTKFSLNTNIVEEKIDLFTPGLPIWAISLIILVVIIFVVVIGYLIFYCVTKKKKGDPIEA